VADVEANDVCSSVCSSAPNLSVPGVVKVLVEATGATATNSCGLGADIF
jgi:hypothetical protein